MEKHRKAVRFLAIAATSAPYGVRFGAGVADKLRQRHELRWISKEGAVLNGDSIQQIVKCRRFAVNYVDVAVHGNSREVSALVKQPLQSGPACGFRLESCARAKEQRGVLERIDHRGAFAVTGTFLVRGRATPFARRGGVLAVLPRSRETALRRPASSNDVLTM
jgi:hypothetical protein